MGSLGDDGLVPTTVQLGLAAPTDPSIRKPSPAVEAEVLARSVRQ
jgi:hypothetical protein